MGGSARDASEVDAYVELKPLGVTLIFSDEGYHTENSKLARGEGALLLRSVLFFPEGYRDYAGFDGALPSGLTFAQNQAVTRSKMGAPEWENANAPAERWLVDGVRIWVRYTKAADSIIQASMTQPRPSELS